MKRSKMIEIITDYLKGADLKIYQKEWRQNELAEGILKDIEKAGMMPPNSPYFLEEFISQDDDIPIVGRIVDSFTWDSEDET